MPERSYVAIHSPLFGMEDVFDELEENPAAGSFYLFASLYAARKLTGGMISGCKGWSAAKWGRLGIPCSSACHAPSSLWHWEGDDLILHHYDHEGDEKFVVGVIARRGVTRNRMLKKLAESESLPKPNAPAAKETGPPPTNGRRAGKARGDLNGSAADHSHGNGNLQGTSPASIEEDLGLQR